ncbi:phage tail protein [Bartonella sp. HY329]|uniref:phage tail-collar fiber domain-containing protein n=1 Tax=unclassified Bartonella TaxID=2645622 RepID=UPI0021C6642E|nr:MULTISPECIES: phage tail protein [unclassified Bartonella]UXM94323.1 phage tail protein [Bartonella sp. HY329]UXN08646.1 phage tail protein [Bartonella sp. HY328]
MAQQTFALMTTKGRAKEAAALASGTSINISHIAIGSGETVPSGGETKLYREVLRKAISGNGLVAGSENTAYFDIFLNASEGPFTIREAGLLDDEGDLIAIAYYDPPINKPVPTSGQTVEGIIRIEVAFSNIANITIKVDPSLNVPLQRLTTTPWVPVKAIDLATPPTKTNIGDSYIIGNNSTGVWAAQEGNLTEFTQGGWAIIATPDGHGVGLPDGRVFTKVNGQYVEVLASQNYVANYRIPSKQLLNPPFVAVIAIDISAPPARLAIGDTYLVPANSTGLWAGKVGQLAEWDGKSWSFTVTPNGHSIGLPDGRVFNKVDGTYIEKIALDSQSGKWNFAEAGGTANELTATLNPVPATLPAGTSINLLIKTNNTEAPTLNLNGLGAKNIIRADNTPCEANDLIAGSIVELLFDGNSFQISGLYKSRLSAHKTVVFSNVGVTNFVVPEGVYLVTVEIWGGGGGGGASIGSGSAGSGGGGGGYVRSAVPVLPNQVIPVTVGVGGTGGITDPAANLYNGKSGSASSFGLFATANGGGGGFLGNNEIVGRAGAGGSGFGNGMKANGGGGGFGWVGAALAGGTGAAAYGVSITSPTMRAPGSNGSYPGGGGGGGSEGHIGGAGANGLVVIQF